MNDPDFVRNRISQLRMDKGVSEYQMSLDLGHSASYIQNIVNGHSNPPVKELYKICDYLDITMMAFFDDTCKDSLEVTKTIELIRKLDAEDVRLIYLNIKRLLRLKGE